ncbi:DUF1080 domain-containing protein [Spirosoma sp. HMF4905]|uniref:non-reducing end alpha-L-arabinofuranosidase n=1 Tax=Spirosoma arboris TaxID=2682092 RepID=A0A7K1SN88_9BACT|nr:family 16 glycoside hydrolase [Spirosoma arboris]MVM35066.1 DUF1080 domain-containing protein [Spirosoma arboris]
MIRSLFIALTFLSVADVCVAQTNQISVDANVVLNKIPATLYGSCMEDVNHEIYGGLYDQKIFGESFEEPASGINYTYWKKSGGYWAADREYSDGSISIVPGRHTRRMVAKNDLDVEPDRNAKLIYQASDVNDGVIDVDLRFLQERGIGASILLRVSNAGIGENALTGYELRLNRENRKLQLIKHLNAFKLLAEKPISFSPDQWNHLKIELAGMHLVAYLNGATQAILDYSDTDAPILTGKLGLCTAGSPTSFNNIQVVSGGKTTVLPLVYPVDQQVSDLWDRIQSGAVNAEFSLEQKNALNGSTTQVINFVSGSGKVGLANRSLNRWGIAVKEGQSFTGSCYLRTPVGSLPVTIALENADGSKTYAKQTVSVSTTTWKKYTFSLVTNSTDPNARFTLYLGQKGKLYVDQITLLSTGENQFKGLPLRADIGNALVSQGLSFLRYAGSMVNAPGYRFKKMIGDRAHRPPYTGHWNEYSTNGFGFEEFLQFCEAANLPAAFAINIEETEQDAADMVEYLNGNVSTPWGKKRAENGHPKPYAVKYIEIGNEEVLFEGDDKKISDHYIERFLALYKAIQEKDPSISLVCSAWWRPKSPNTEAVFKALDGKAAYWDYHVWADDKNSGPGVDKEITRMDSLFHAWSPNTTMKCAIFEENGGLHNMQRALGHATILNAVRRHGDFILTSCPANALEPYLQNDNGWNQGQIFFTPTQVWGMPPFYAQQMASRNHLPLRVSASVQGTLDITATRSENGEILVLHIVNVDSLAQETAIRLQNFSMTKQVQATTLAGPLDGQNLPDSPKAISAEDKTIDLASEIMNYRFPAHSYTILRFERP